METNTAESDKYTDDPHYGCTKFIEVLHLVLDNEATEEELAFFRQRIETSRFCVENYEDANTLKQLIKTKVQRHCAPPDLCQCIEQLLLTHKPNTIS